MLKRVATKISVLSTWTLIDISSLELLKLNKAISKQMIKSKLKYPEKEPRTFYLLSVELTFW